MLMMLSLWIVAINADNYYTGCVNPKKCPAESTDEDDEHNVQCVMTEEPEDVGGWTEKKLKKNKKIWFASECTTGTWDEAKAKCEKMGGRLPVIREQQKKDLIGGACKDTDRVWTLSKFDETVNAVREWFEDKALQKEIEGKFKTRECWEVSDQMMKAKKDCKAECKPKRKKCKKEAKKIKDKELKKKKKQECANNMKQCKAECTNGAINSDTSLTFSCNGGKGAKAKKCKKCQDSANGSIFKVDCGQPYCSGLKEKDCNESDKESGLVEEATDNDKKYCVYLNKRMQLTENIIASQIICAESACKGVDTNKCQNWEEYKMTLLPVERAYGMMCAACGVCVSKKAAKAAARALKPRTEFLPLKFSEDDDDLVDEERNLESDVEVPLECETGTPATEAQHMIIFPTCYCYHQCIDVNSDCPFDERDKRCCAKYALKPNPNEPSTSATECQEYYSSWNAWYHKNHPAHWSPETPIAGLRDSKKTIDFYKTSLTYLPDSADFAGPLAPEEISGISIRKF
jgi:hypothetical protein